MNGEGSERSAQVCFVALSGVLVFASGAAAKTIEVNEGESIQATVDAAEPGDTIIAKPGTYRESVVVTKTLTIQGEGRPTLLPPVQPPATLCIPEEPDFNAGFCVTGDVETASASSSTGRRHRRATRRSCAT